MKPPSDLLVYLKMYAKTLFHEYAPKKLKTVFTDISTKECYS